MKCPKCQADNPTGSKFCSECGTQLGPSIEDIAFTETIESPKEEITTGVTFAGRYQIIEELGKGGMGRVYKALDTEVNEKVAIKLIKPEIAADKKTIERFRNELKFARKIRHKNVCQMFDLNKEEGSYYITMEYVAGEDLKGLSKKMGQLSAGQAISIAKQICDGLEEAHKLGVVHRDLKPQNIMIDKEGDARIMDFGIARSIEGKSITGAGVMIGTPDYMSPEQVDGKETDQRSDIYSLGIILYEMVTGQTPFEGDTPFTIGVKHKSETPRAPKELNSQVPDDLNHVILKCLEKEKENRYQSATELRNELTNIQKGIPTTERIVPDRKPLTSREITVQFSLKKLLIPAIIFIAVAAIGIIIWQLLPQKEVVSAPKIENSIAIISFNNRTGDTAFDYLQNAIPNLLITSLEQTGYFYVATWERMHDLLKQMGKENVSLIDSDLGFELCRREGIQAIVLGSITKAGDMFATEVKILDVDNKKLLKSGSSKGEGVSSILKTQIDELSREISKGISIPAAKFDETQTSIIDVTTSSMEAYNYFLKGGNELTKFYFEDAIKLLEKAVELDPTFAVAHIFLGIAYGNSGNTKGRNEAFENAKKYSAKTSDKERLWIESLYAHYIGRDREKAIDLLKHLIEKYPREDFFHHDLGNLFRISRRYKEAIEEFTKALELDPNYGLAMNHMAYTYSAMEEYEKAIEYLQKYSSLSPDNANPLDSMGEIYLIMGNLDESIAKYKEASEIKPGLGSDWKLGYAYALKQDYVEAMKWADKQISRSLAQGDKAIGHWWKGFYLYWLGNTEKALDSIDIAEKMAEVLRSMERRRSWLPRSRRDQNPFGRTTKTIIQLTHSFNFL